MIPRIKQPSGERPTASMRPRSTSTSWGSELPWARRRIATFASAQAHVVATSVSDVEAIAVEPETHAPHAIVLTLVPSGASSRARFLSTVRRQSPRSISRSAVELFGPSALTRDIVWSQPALDLAPRTIDGGRVGGVDQYRN